MADNDPYVGGISPEYRNSATNLGRPALGEGEEAELKKAAIKDEESLSKVVSSNQQDKTQEPEEKPTTRKTSPRPTSPKSSDGG